MNKPLTLNERRSLAGFKGWRTRREGKTVETPRCPACNRLMPQGAVEHQKRFHVDLYQRRARKHGELL